MNNHNLDDLSIYPSLDPSNMLRHLHDIPDLCSRAWEQVQHIMLPQDYHQVDKVVMLGMGGSAIGCDLLAGLIVNECRTPIFICREYTPPAFLDDNTLVIASSYSGATEETLSAFNPLIHRSCKKIVMTSGGRLAQLAKEHSIPAFILDYQSPPRAALSLSFLALLGIFCKLGLIDDKSADLAESCSILREYSRQLNENIPEEHNQAKQLARCLYGKMTIIYGAEHLSEVAGRWRLQINENAKAWAFNATFPELNHNATTGYEFPKDISRNTHVVMLRCSNLHPRILLRYDITGHLLDNKSVQYTVLDARGKSRLAQMLSLILVGDYVSYYLALLYGIDPYPIKAVDFLRSELAKT
ncbi:MAG: bifunctional phosphoglucose/phosphomannose isomerase [Dehalococcoidia bacterium]|nr:bifunctional phosphoglucose/phosphomannose isomerase [Dehalococcoidia bacterium]